MLSKKRKLVNINGVKPLPFHGTVKTDSKIAAPTRTPAVRAWLVFVEAHDKAIRLAMAQVEAFAATRVRLDGQYDYRCTSNLVKPMLA